MIRTIIIDDEPAAVDVLVTLLKNKCRDIVDIIATSNFPMEGKKLIEQSSPDLVFLDIEMPGITGIDLLRSFTDPAFRVVFVTAFDSYAIEAFHLSAIDYLLKPVEEEDLVRAVLKIKNEFDKNHHTLKDQLHHLEQLLTHHPSLPEPRLGICMSGRIAFINITDILYCEASGSYTNVYINDGKKMVASKSLSEFELQLVHHNFFRIHRSSLININRIKEFQRDDGGYVTMENGKRLEVSQRKRKEFLDAILGIFV